MKMEFAIPIERFRVAPEGAVNLAEHDTAWAGTPEMLELGKKALKKRAKTFLENNVAELAKAQELLYADDRYAVLIVFQAMDAAGKDGTIKHVMSGVNPQGCQVFSFKAPSKEELDHDFLWRCAKSLPERGRIGIFNRSYYEEVLVVRVHPAYLDHQKLPGKTSGTAFWQARYQDINAFERHLVRNGTEVIKFFLNVSKAEQKERFLARLDNPEKNWKFSEADLAERAHWGAYQAAYAEAISATSTQWAPWYVIPADHKWVMRALVSHIITTRIHALGLSTPKQDEARRAALSRARKALEKEEG
jgi:PPK2 family polyphosphate:nucleotide phosphotransferase